MGVERERGSIEVGKLADLAVLSQDILAVAPNEIRRTSALITLVGGREVYRSGM
jgi:predicted amidohydrolase YtcJ